MIQIQSSPAETDEETPRSGAEILLQIVNSLGDLCQIGEHALQKREAEVAWLEERVHAARSEREELAIFTQGLQKLTDYLNDHLPMLEEGTLSGESPDLAEIQKAYEEAKSQAEELTQELEMTIFERDSLFEELQERSKSLAALERQARAWAAEAVDGAVFEDEALDEDEEALDAALDKDFAANLQAEESKITELISDESLVADLLDEEERAGDAELETTSMDLESADGQDDEDPSDDIASTSPEIQNVAPDAEEDENDLIVSPAADDVENAAPDLEIESSEDEDRAHAEPTDTPQENEDAVSEASTQADAERFSTGINETENELEDTLAALKDDLLGDEDEDEDEDQNQDENKIEFEDSVPKSPDSDDAGTQEKAVHHATSDTCADEDIDGRDVESTDTENSEAESAEDESTDGPEYADAVNAGVEDKQTLTDKADAPTPMPAAPVNDLLPAEVSLDHPDELADPSPSGEGDENSAAVDDEADAVVTLDGDAKQKAPRQDVPAPVAPAPLLLDDLDDLAASEENDELAADSLANKKSGILQVHALPALLEGNAFSENEMRFASILSSGSHSMEELSEKLGLGLDETRKQIDTLLQKDWVALRSDES